MRGDWLRGGGLKNILTAGVVTAVLSLGVNLFLTATTFRQSLEHEARQKVQRQLNMLLLVRGELDHMRQVADRGELELVQDNGRVALPRATLPNQMWSVQRWDDATLNLDSQFVEQLASFYDDVYYAQDRLHSIGNALEVNSAMGRWVEGVLVGSGEAKSMARMHEVLRTPSADLILQGQEYVALVKRIRERLPDVIGAVDAEVRGLRVRLDRQ